MLRLLVIALLLGATACGGYTHVSTVQRDPLGGTLAIRHNESSWEEARQRMRDHCGNYYAIVDERRVVVGQRTTTEVTDEGEAMVTLDIHELQVTYECRPKTPAG